MASPSTDRRLGLVGNTAYKAPVTVVATVNVVQSGEQTIDTVAVKAINAANLPDRVLCTGQTDPTQNGIWDVSTAAWTRSKDANGNYDFVKGSQVFVSRGSAANSIWALTAADPVTIGTSSLTWSQALTTAFLPTLAASGGSALIGFLQVGTGAVARTVQAKLRELISSADFNNTRGTDNWGYGDRAIDSMQPSGAGTAVDNIGIGTDALTACVDGFGSTAIGKNALKAMVGNAYCTAVGAYALEFANLVGNVNLICTAVGAYAGNKNTTGQYLTAIGSSAGFGNTTGSFNTYVGQNCGVANDTGVSNTAVGHSALQLNIGSRNVAVGETTLAAATSVDDTIAIGYHALAANLTADQCIAIGTNALTLATVGPNIAIGYRAAESVQTGANNVVLGHLALLVATGATSRNIAIGTEAVGALTTNSDCVGIGYRALFTSVSGQQVAIGTQALTLLSNGGGTGSVGVGYQAGSNMTTGSNNIFLGAGSGTDAMLNVTTASNQIVMGNNAITNATIKVAWTVTSDARDKTDPADIDRGLDFVLSLKPKSYKLMDRETQKATTGKRYGFFAQDILAEEGDDHVLIVADDPENLKMNESMMVPILVKALQEAWGLIDELSDRVRAIEASLSANPA